MPVTLKGLNVERTRHWKLASLFFLHGMAMGMWFVPLTRVLDAHGMGALRPFAFAASALASMVSPLIFGAMADRHASPVRVLRGLALVTSVAMACAAGAIHLGGSPGWVLALIQVHALFSAPTWSISTTIVLSGLEDARHQFGPLRAMGTLGWMAGCWVVSGLGADTSPLAGYCGAGLWMLVAAFTLVLPSVEPPAAAVGLTLRQRLGMDAWGLMKTRDHRVVFVTAALVSVPLAAFYPFTPPHLRDLGFERTAAWMSVGQITEMLSMFALAWLLARWRLKWIFAAGLGFALLRYVLCAVNSPGWLLAGVSLHGLAFTLFFVTAPIYLNERVPPEWRARAQALMTLMTAGLGNLTGYLGAGWWLAVCTAPTGIRWSLFWGGLAAAVAAVLLYFLRAYRGQGRV